MAVAIYFGLLQLSVAQYSETIISGRPGQALPPYAVGKNIFQIQSGIQFDHSESEGDFEMQGYALNNFLRYGITETFELNSTLELRDNEIELNNNDLDQQGVSIWSLGLRYNIFHGEKVLPDIGFQFSLGLRAVSEDFKADHTAPAFSIILLKNISDRLSLDGNVGASWDGFDPDPQWNYIANLAYSLSGKVGVMAEVFGSTRDENADVFADFGLGYLVTDNLQLDIFGGFGKNDLTDSAFLTTGISWRTGR